jgi:hypothetical protein
MNKVLLALVGDHQQMHLGDGLQHPRTFSISAGQVSNLGLLIWNSRQAGKDISEIPDGPGNIALNVKLAQDNETSPQYAETQEAFAALHPKSAWADLPWQETPYGGKP